MQNDPDKEFRLAEYAEFRLAEYAALRDEIVFQHGASHSIERDTVIGAVAVFAWLLSHKPEESQWLLFHVAAVLPLGFVTIKFLRKKSVIQRSRSLQNISMLWRIGLGSVLP